MYMDGNAYCYNMNSFDLSWDWYRTDGETDDYETNAHIQRDHDHGVCWDLEEGVDSPGGHSSPLRSAVLGLKNMVVMYYGSAS